MADLIEEITPPLCIYNCGRECAKKEMYSVCYDNFLDGKCEGCGICQHKIFWNLCEECCGKNGALSYEEWESIYKPIKNHLNKDDETHYFETYGEELDYVKSRFAETPNKIWTYHDGDDGELIISSGFHVVNRLAYYITEVGFQEGESIYVTLSNENTLECFNCGQAVERDSSAHDECQISWDGNLYCAECSDYCVIDEPEE